jgi:hypothetical protein
VGGLILEQFFNLLGNYFFPMVLSVYLVFKIDKLMTSLVSNQKDFSDKILLEMKEIKQDILNIRLDISSALKH